MKKSLYFAMLLLWVSCSNAKAKRIIEDCLEKHPKIEVVKLGYGNLSTTDRAKYKLDFIGKVLETTTIHLKDGQSEIASIEKFSYDPMGRLLKHTHQMTGHPQETLAENSYDELGQLIQKKVGNTPATPLQTVDYSYNIRGWLTQINDVNNIQNDLFSFNIRYNDPVSGTALYNGNISQTALYNGNISQTRWRTNNTDSSLKDYTYSYDALNRITGALDNTIDNRYSLEGVTYDKNGNILTLNRRGHINEAADDFGIMDELTYGYDSGNKLLKVADSAHDIYGFKDDAVATEDNDDDYSYDENGNMISDTNKGITSISYNHLNLPTEIVFNNDQSQKINYIYTADGIKQQKVVNDNTQVTTTGYNGGYIYENGSLKFISHPEGYIEPDGAGGYDYVYQYKDHLGNVRLSYSDNSEILTDNSFDSTTEGWGGVATVLSQENGRLRAEVTNQWAGAQKYFDVAVGDELHYELMIDKATTDHLIVHIVEHDSNYGKLKTTAVVDGADGFISGTYTVTEGSKLRIKITKNGNDNGIPTYYYIDDVKVIKKDISVREENNYYPFRLQHKGYNSQVTGTHHNWDFQGQERAEDLGLNVLEFKYRVHDPAIGRFWQVDPLAEKYVYNGTYNFAENKVIQFNELEGLEAGTPAFYVETALKAKQKIKSFFSGTEKVATGTTNAFNGAASGDTAMRQAAEAKNNSNGSEPMPDPNVQLVMEGAAQIDNAIPNAPTIREVANGMEVAGDAMVVSAPATGPYAPAVAGAGEVISTAGTGTNIALDLAEGDVKSAAKRVIIEGISLGLSSIARQSPHVNELAEQVIDAHIIFYEDVAVPLVEKEIKKKQEKQ